MDERYLGAFLALKSHKVAGRTLRPFCLRHRLTLEAIGSPCLPGSDRPVTKADLLLAARICASRDPQEALSRPGWRDALTLTVWRLWPVAWMRDLARWVTYLEDSATQPVIGSNRKSATKAKPNRGLDWSLAVVVGLMELGFSEDEAWTMPEGRALHYFFAYAIRGGAELDFWTTEDEAALPRMRQAIAADIEKVKALVKAGKISPPGASKDGPRVRLARPPKA